MVLFAPFLGDKALLEEIRSAGGVQRWQPGPLPPQVDSTNYQRQVWKFIREQPALAGRVWLACGSDDYLLSGARLLATTAARRALRRNARRPRLAHVEPHRQDRVLSNPHPGARHLMKLATFKTAQGTSYGAVTGKGIVDLRRFLGNQYPDLKSLIAADALDQAKKHLSEAPDYKARTSPGCR